MNIKQGNRQPVTYNLNSGFGLLETVLALGLLVIVVAAAVFLANTALKRSQLNVIRGGAYQIAKEQLELLRQIRDTNFQKGLSWDGSFPASNFHIFYDSNNVPTINSSGCKLSPLNNTQYLYYLTVQPLTSTSLPTGADPQSQNNYKKVTINVTWGETDTTNCNFGGWNSSERIQVETILTNWKRL